MALLQLMCLLLGLKNVCSGLSVAAMLCQDNAVKRVCACFHRLMIWNKTCRLSAAAPALSSRRATSPSSSASSTASSGPPTSGSSTRRPSGSQEVLRYCCKAHPLELCPNNCWFTLIFNPVSRWADLEMLKQGRGRSPTEWISLVVNGDPCVSYTKWWWPLYLKYKMVVILVSQIQTGGDPCVSNTNWWWCLVTNTK